MARKRKSGFELDGGRTFDTLEAAYAWCARNRRKAPRYLTLGSYEDFGDVSPFECSAYRRLFGDVGAQVLVATEDTPAGVAWVSWDKERNQVAVFRSRQETARADAMARLGLGRSAASRPVIDLLYALAAPGEHRPPDWKPAGSRAVTNALNSDLERFKPVGKRWHRTTVRRLLARLEAEGWPTAA